MSNWTYGYVTDVGYTAGFHSDLVPARLAFAALLAGLRAPDPASPLSYCELGCGQGLTPVVVAAASPRAQLHAEDFNPTHILQARSLSGGLPNLHLSDLPFSDYAADPALPELDIIVLHGVLSWVSLENRAHIVDFIRRKLKLGGLVYVSYNCSPGWAAAAPMGELMRLHGAGFGGPTMDRLSSAVSFLRQLKDADAGYFRANPGMAARFDATFALNANYLAHEYLNGDWHILSSAQVRAEMGEAKLSFLGSATVSEQISQLSYTPDQQALLTSISDPVIREATRDFILNQQFRRDLFVKGAVPLSREETDAVWDEQRFAAVTLRTPDDLKGSTAVGEIGLKAEVYDPLLSLMEAGPRAFREIAADPVMAHVDRPSLRQAMAVLVALNRVHPALPEEGEAERRASTSAFNDRLLQRAVWANDLDVLASPVLGGGLSISPVDQLLLVAHRESQPDPVGFARAALTRTGGRLSKNGRVLESEEETMAELQDRLTNFPRLLRLMETLGVA